MKKTQLILFFILIVLLLVITPSLIVANTTTNTNNTHKISNNIYQSDPFDDPFNNDNNNNDNDDPFDDPFNNDDNSNDSNNDNNNDDDPFNDPFNNDDNDNNNTDGNSNDNDDDPFNDPFGNDNNNDNNSDPFGDPFSSNDNSNDNNNDDDFTISIDNIDIPKPEILIHGTAGLGISVLFQGDNEYSKDSDDPKVRYLTTDAYGNIKFDYDFNHFKMLASIDLLATIDSTAIPKFELGLEEIYFKYYTDKFEIALGHLLIDWSPMTVYKLTDFFNPMAFNVYTQQLSEGVNGIQSKIFIDINHPSVNYMFFEFVVLPLYTESNITTSRINPFTSDTGDLGQTDIDDPDDTGGEHNTNQSQNSYEDDTQSPAPTTLTIDNSPPSFDILNTQFGFRYGITFPGVDLYLMYFHGYHNDFMFSYTNNAANIDIGDSSDDILTSIDDYGDLMTGARILDVKRVYRIKDSIGLSSSFNLWGITFQAETTFTFNMPVLYKRQVLIQSTGLFTDRALTTAPTLQFSLGLNWEIISNLRLIVEYSEFFVFKEIDLYKESLPGNNIFASLVYILSTPNIEMTFMQGANFDYMDKQMILISYIKADFLNGLIIDLAVAYFNDFGDVIDGEEQTEGIFGPLNRSVVVGLLVYYQF